MCGLCWGRSILNPKIAKILEISGSDNHTVFVNTGGIWELLLNASHEQFASILELYHIQSQDDRVRICCQIIEDELLYSMIQPLNHDILDWFEQHDDTDYAQFITYPLGDPVRMYVIPTTDVPSKIFDAITPLMELKNYGKRRLN